MSNAKIPDLTVTQASARVLSRSFDDHDELIRRLRELAKSNDLVVCSGRELIVLLDALEAQATHISELRENGDRLVRAADGWKEMYESASRNERRYLWLRDLGPHGDTATVDVLVMDENEDGTTDTWYRPTPEELDAVIDAALAKGPVSGPGSETRSGEDGK